MEIIQVLLMQISLFWEDPEKNQAQLEALLDKMAPIAPGTLVIFPETMATGFTMNFQAVAPAKDEGWETFLAQTAADRQIGILIGLARKEPSGQIFNEALFFDPDLGLIATYKKMRPFSGAGEADVITPGNQVITFKYRGLTFCPLICYDLRFPELFRLGVQQGAECFIVIANWPARRSHHWISLLQARAIENLAYVIGVNRVGSDPNADYVGDSRLIDPQGALVAIAGSEETVITAEIDPQVVRQWREDFPALRDFASHPSLLNPT